MDCYRQHMNILQSHAIYTETGCVDGYLILDHGCICDIITDPQLLPDGDIIYYGDKRILPGIIDIHIHGYRTFGARSLRMEDVAGLSGILPSIGVTGALPTICGWSMDHPRILETAADAILHQNGGAKLLGIHMEGSFFHPTRHNATPRCELQTPSIALCETMWKAMKGTWRYVTMAPELPHADEVIHWLREHKIIVGGGHTCADASQFVRAKQCGMATSIHTGNAMNQIDRRDIGFMGAALVDPDIYCEINCDLVHLSKEMLTIMFRIKKDLNRFLMISDADTISGVEPGYYMVNSQPTTITEDGRMLLDDGTIAGSCRHILYGIHNLCEVLHMPMEQVITMSSLNPARLLGLQQTKGSIARGKDGDIVIIDDHYDVVETYVEGHSVYRKGDTLMRNPWFQDDVPRIRR